MSSRWLYSINYSTSGSWWSNHLHTRRQGQFDCFILSVGRSLAVLHICESINGRREQVVEVGWLNLNVERHVSQAKPMTTNVFWTKWADICQKKTVSYPVFVPPMVTHLCNQQKKNPSPHLSITRSVDGIKNIHVNQSSDFFQRSSGDSFLCTLRVWSRYEAKHRQHSKVNCTT